MANGCKFWIFFAAFCVVIPHISTTSLLYFGASSITPFVDKQQIAISVYQLQYTRAIHPFPCQHAEGRQMLDISIQICIMDLRAGDIKLPQLPLWYGVSEPDYRWSGSPHKFYQRQCYIILKLGKGIHKFYASNHKLQVQSNTPFWFRLLEWNLLQEKIPFDEKMQRWQIRTGLCTTTAQRAHL